jgi:hypothetical protein
MRGHFDGALFIGLPSTDPEHCVHTPKLLLAARDLLVPRQGAQFRGMTRRFEAWYISNGSFRCHFGTDRPRHHLAQTSPSVALIDTVFQY